MDKLDFVSRLIEIIDRAFESVAKRMGKHFGKPAPAVDVEGFMRNHAEATVQREQTYREQRDRDNAEFIRRLADMKNITLETRQREQERFQCEQDRMEQERNVEREQYEERITRLLRGMKEAEDKVQVLMGQLGKPIRDRESKLAFVNGLQLTIRQTESLLLVGPKGTGKSTFLWLLNKGQKPIRTTGDGTEDIIQISGFVDTIGLRGWAPEELLKLLVLLIYEGIPKDLLVFGNDRVALPIASLALVGIMNPMLVIMSGDFWQNYLPTGGEQQRVNLVESSNGVRQVEPASDLKVVYNFPAYQDVRDFHLGTPVTHHDNLEVLVRERENAGIHPFQPLMDRLGLQFTVGMENDYNMEALFRLIYIFEKKYGKDKLQFMNDATLHDFA